MERWSQACPRHLSERDAVYWKRTGGCSMSKQLRAGAPWRSRGMENVVRKTGIVTVAVSGMCLGIATALAEAGTNVAMADIHQASHRCALNLVDPHGSGGRALCPKNSPCGRCRHRPERTVNQPWANLSMTSRAARDDVRHKTEIGSTSNSTPATTKPRLGDDEGLRRAGRVRNDSKRRATESEVCCVNPGCSLGHVAGDTAG